MSEKKGSVNCNFPRMGKSMSEKTQISNAPRINQEQLAFGGDEMLC